uniref:Rho GTPase-activating protein 27-like n=2 Tax=Callorhinchus milii TaxID=7868 RepID=A0A4W3ICI8_CALMI
MKLGESQQRLWRMEELIHSLPVMNHDTMRFLFRHLRRVIENRDKNRMSSQSMAIVFGPTLLRPEVETGSMALYMAHQNQIVDFILNNFKQLFPEGQDWAESR